MCCDTMQHSGPSRLVYSICRLQNMRAWCCRELKQRATAVIEERVWHDVYHLAPLKTMSGATGWLYHAWGNPWKVYSCEDEEARQLGGLLKAFSEARAAGGGSLRPESSEVAELLGAAADERDPRRKVIRLW